MTYYQQTAHPAAPIGPPKTKIFAPSLLTAELRKFMTTSSWWGLLIPTVLLALGWSWGFSAMVSGVAEYFSKGMLSSLGLFDNSKDMPWSSIALVRAINISTIFPMVLGGLALSNEVQRRTLTTTFLTAPSRVSVLTAKFGVYAIIGAVYGVIIVAVSSLGMYLGAVTGGNTEFLPGAGTWLGIAGAGILATILWTLFSVGIGALIGNVIATTLTLLLYTLLAENLLALALQQSVTHFPAFLINSSGAGIVGGIAADDIAGSIPDLPLGLRGPITDVMRAIAGASGTYAWWVEALIFLAWTVIACGLGWFVARRRDVS